MHTILTSVMKSQAIPLCVPLPGHESSLCPAYPGRVRYLPGSQLAIFGHQVGYQRQRPHLQCIIISYCLLLCWN